MGKAGLIITLLVFTVVSAEAQVRIRLFSELMPESAIFSVTGGQYYIDAFPGGRMPIKVGQPVYISRNSGMLVVKTLGSPGFFTDSVFFSSHSGDDSFSLRIIGVPLRQYYSGDLKCFPDLGTILFINNCDEEKYIAGVVKAEGGSGRNIEYFKSQAVIARTYTHKYFDKHISDGYNLCDNTHCQVYNGVSDDTVLNRAALDTKDLVILDSDSALIISAFHSNCGGETSSSENVWLTGQPYLKKVTDPYCYGSRNAAWQKSIPGKVWISALQNSGYSGPADDLSLFGYLQTTRTAVYKTGSFTIPFITLRKELGLRSAFFSVIPEGDSVILKGRGYGHGVGLCQEGAMVMAEKGFDFRQIIDFYYNDVIIAKIPSR